MSFAARGVGIYERSTCGDLRLTGRNAIRCDGPTDAVPTESPEVGEVVRDVVDRIDRLLARSDSP